jgi:PAS domain S-box-containing protein
MPDSSMNGRRLLQQQLMLVAVLVVLALAARNFPLGAANVPAEFYLPLHTLLEFLAAMVAFMVFATVWHTPLKEMSASLIWMAMALMSSGWLDLAHALSFKGMPALITPSSVDKGIDFWLLARLVVAVSLSMISLKPELPPSSKLLRYFFLAIYSVVTLAALVAVLFHRESLPLTFVEGQGVTQFKTAIEWVIVVLLALTAWRYFLQAQSTGSEFPAYIFGAAAVAAVGETFFTSFQLYADYQNLLGHIYKILSYGLIYQAMFVIGVRRPYNRLAEKKDLLSRANETLRIQALALASTATPVLVTDLQGDVHWSNRTASVMTVTKFPWLDKKLSLFSAPLTPDPKMAEDMRTELLAGKVWRGLVHVNDSRGNDTIMDRTVTPLRNDEGVIEGYVAVAENVTESIQAQLRHKRVLDTALDGFWINDMSGRLLEVNQAYARMSGYSVNELLTMTIAQLEVAEQAEEVQRHLQNVIQAGHDQFETRHRHKLGHEFCVEVSVTFDPEMQQFFVFLRDITDRLQSATAKQDLEQQLQQAQKMEAIGQLTGGIAHDFNNILASVLGYSRLALDRLVPDKQSKLAAYLTEVITASERARDLIAKMLTFTRTTPSANVVPISPATAVQEVLAMLRPSMPSSIQLNLRIDDDLKILMDAGELNQILLNLLINARDAIDGQGDIGIRLRRVAADGKLCAVSHQRLSGAYLSLEVTDNGSGIPPEHMSRLFDPFFTTKDVGKGTGLGLSMVQGLLRRSGGYIVVESQPGQGSLFQLLFPIASDNPSADVVQATSQGSHGGSGQHIWVVDDEPAVARYLHELLAGRDYHVTLFSSPAEVLTRFEGGDKTVDLLITDKTMPGISGMELAMRLHQSVPELPVIMCTGYGSDTPMVEGSQNHIRHFFIKPVPAEDLLQAIAEELPDRP